MPVGRLGNGQRVYYHEWMTITPFMSKEDYQEQRRENLKW